MSIEDLTIYLNDTLDDLDTLIIQGRNPAMQHALRVHAGFYIMQLREMTDNLDYNYALQLCDLDQIEANAHKQAYLDAVREMMEVQA